MRTLLTTALVFAAMAADAQEAAEMASGLRSSGKIYVVVLVLATIFAGIIAYLIYLDRKIKKLEDKNS